MMKHEAREIRHVSGRAGGTTPCLGGAKNPDLNRIRMSFVSFFWDYLYGQQHASSRCNRVILRDGKIYFGKAIANNSL